MVAKRILRFFLVLVLSVVAALLVFVVISVAPVNRTPIEEFSAYQEMTARLDSLDSLSIPKAKHYFSVGFAKENLTPKIPTTTAGYAKRKGKLYPSVRDSIYVRALVIDNGVRKVAIVSADLLIIPPTVTEKLEAKLNRIGFSLENTYLGATHSHNSIGNWGEGAARFLYGAYDETVVNLIADKIVLAVKNASQNTLPSKLLTGAIPVPNAVDNRLIDGGPEDSLMRVIQVHRADSSKLLLMTYTAHATCLFSKDLELSRDYPGKLVDTIEASGYDFAMFMAGSVGSHGCNSPDMGEVCIDWMANEVSTRFLAQRSTLHPVQDSTLFMVRVGLPLSDPQVKVLPEWKVRSWLFRSAFGEYPVYLTGLRLGEVVFLGIPADFSGEFNPALDSVATKNGVAIIPTSFNGGYIGYLTPRFRYEENHYETQLVNWYAPGTGEYVEQSLAKILKALSRKR